MKPDHPQDQEWMSLLYGEASKDQTQSLKRHLAQCGHCQNRYQQWRRTLRVLDQDRVEKARPAPLRPAFSFGLRWAAAAAVLLALGFLAGRFLLAQAGAGALWTSAMEQRVRAQVTTELAQQWDRRQAALLALWQEQCQAGLTASTASLLQSQEDLAGSLAEAERARQEQFQGMWNALVQAQADYRRDLGLLRRDLETVAVYSEGRWSQTEANMLRLASHAPAGDSTEIPSQPSTTP